MTRNVITAYLTTLICLGLLSCSYIYSDNLIVLRNCKYFLAAYCVADVYGNTLEMIIHHTATILLGYILHIASYTELSLQEKDMLTITTVVLMQTEISTIPLNMMYIGYKNNFMKAIFIISFFYFRIIRVPRMLVSNKDTCFYCPYKIHPIETICLDNLFCYYSWVFSTLVLLSLNLIWMVKIVLKLR
jgi:hypothetical protein